MSSGAERKAAAKKPIPVEDVLSTLRVDFGEQKDKAN
jgi:hypothetical protein